MYLSPAAGHRTIAHEWWLPGRLLAILTETGFPAGRLEVEITENALIADLEEARVVLDSLKEIGAKIALDDFGTGYSNLAHLSA